MARVRLVIISYHRHIHLILHTPFANPSPRARRNPQILPYIASHLHSTTHTFSQAHARTYTHTSILWLHPHAFIHCITYSTHLFLFLFYLLFSFYHSSFACYSFPPILSENTHPPRSKKYIATDIHVFTLTYSSSRVYDCVEEESTYDYYFYSLPILIWSPYFLTSYPQKKSRALHILLPWSCYCSFSLYYNSTLAVLQKMFSRRICKEKIHT